MRPSGSCARSRRAVSQGRRMRYSLDSVFHAMSRNGFFSIGFGLSIELCEGADAVFVIGNSTRLATAVHGQNGVAHVHAAQGDGRCQDVAECAAAGYVAMIDEALAGHTGFAAQFGKDGSRSGIAGVFLCGVELDDGPAAQQLGCHAWALSADTMNARSMA